jgi:hypothetical protein
MSKDPHIEDWQGRTLESVRFSRRVAIASFGLAASILTVLAVKYLLK